MKRVEFSEHSKLQMKLRGTNQKEVRKTIKAGTRKPGRRNRLHSQFKFNYNRKSPVNNKHYKYKVIDAIFVG